MNSEEFSHKSHEFQQNNFDISESDSNMNEDQQALFLDIRKSCSNDSFLGKFLGTTQQIEKRPLVLNLQAFQPAIPAECDRGTGKVSVNMSIFKKVKKQKRHNKCDYQKNICGYITKKIIREFIGSTFEDLVETLCKKYYCDSEEARKFYLSKVQYITGPSHIFTLLRPEQNQSEKGVRIKLAFRQFFNWFLKERYLRYLILQGKMTDKKAYIQYKNKVLFAFLQEDALEAEKLAKKLLLQKLEEKLEISGQIFKLMPLQGKARGQQKASFQHIKLNKTIRTASLAQNQIYETNSLHLN